MKKDFLAKLIDWSLGNKFWVITLTVGFLILTVSQIENLTVDAVPDITNVQVVVNTKTLGLDPERVELTVTHPIEQEMMGIPGISDLRSISKLGLSQVTIIFKDGTDIYWARQQVAERLQTANGQLPQDMQPELAPISTGLGEVYMYSLDLKENSPLLARPHKEQMLYLREIQDFVVRPHLRRVTGVADIDSNGGMKKELHINIDPHKLTEYGLTIDKVEESLHGLGESFGGGSIVINKETLVIRSQTSMESIDEIGEIPLAMKWNGRPVLLKHVAAVSMDPSPRLGSATFDGKETVLGTVLMRSGGNGRQVSADVADSLRTLKLPEDVKLTQLYSREFLVNTTLTTVTKNLLEGAILVVLILLAVLGHLRAALIVSLVIPLSMLGTSFGMQVFDISGNLMSLGAIDFGLVVDGAVVLVETLIAAFQMVPKEKRSSIHKDEFVCAKAKEVMRPVVFGLFMIMLVYLPILMLEGVEGKMFRPMALTVLMTLGWSLLFTVFLIPVLVSLLIKIPETDHADDHDTWLFRKLKQAYKPLLLKSLPRARILMISGATILLIAGVVFSRFGSEFIPQLDEGDLVINITRSARISLDEALKEQIMVEKRISSLPEVEKVFSRLGTPESATDPMGVHLADTFIILKKDRSLWKANSKEEIFENIRERIQGTGEHEVSSTQPIEMRFNEMLEGSRADVSLRVSGPDLPYLVEMIDKFEEKVRTIKGLEGAEMDPLTALRKSNVVDIKPKFLELSRLGIPLDVFNQTIVAFMQGKRIGLWTEGIRKFPIIVHLSEDRRDQLDEIRNLPVVLPEGGSVSLHQIADINIKEQVTTIARNWGKRYGALSLNISGRDTMSFVNDVKKVVASVPVKEGHEVTLGGQFNNLERAKKKLLLIIPFTLFLIVFILWREFASMKDALIIFLCVPFATCGGIFALYLRGIDLSLSAAVGFIALIGIALLNGIVLITVFNQLRKDTDNIKDVVIEGTLSRFRPVIMTALVASIGFIPMALNTGLGSEVQKPLATVVIGGIMFSTLLTLILLPSVYLYFYETNWRSPFARRL